MVELRTIDDFAANAAFSLVLSTVFGYTAHTQVCRFFCLLRLGGRTDWRADGSVDGTVTFHGYISVTLRVAASRRRQLRRAKLTASSPCAISFVAPKSQGTRQAIRKTAWRPAYRPLPLF